MRFVDRGFLGGQVGVAHEDQVRAEALPGQLERELLHAHAQTTGHGVLIGSLEREKHEVEGIWGQARKGRHGASWRWSQAVKVLSKSPLAYPGSWPSMHDKPHFVLLFTLARPQQGWKGRKACRSSSCYPKTGYPRRGTTSRLIFPFPHHRRSTREPSSPPDPTTWRRCSRWP